MSHLRHTAYHEAGHAVVALRLGYEVGKVTIIPRYTSLGSTETRRRTSPDDIRIDLAGALAEALVNPTPFDEKIQDGSRTDWRNTRRSVRNFVALGFINGRERDILTEELLQETRALVWRDKKAIARVAAALLEHKTLTGDDIKRIVGGSAATAGEFHPLAGLFPMLDKDSPGFKALVEDIKANGQQEAVWLYEGKILDGRNRWNACQHLEIDVLTREYTGADPIGFVLSVNLHRRHLNTSQRAMVGARLTSLSVGANQHTKEGTSIEVASKLLNVGRASIDRARQVLAKGNPSVIEEVEKGKISVTDAAKGGPAAKGGNKGKGEKAEPTATASVRYKEVENKLIEKLLELKPKQADTAAAGTIKRLRATVAMMLKPPPVVARS